MLIFVKKMKDRIAKILREEGMTAAKFAEEIGVQASGISHILSGRNNPSSDFLIKILERFRGINSEWLLLGKGNMYKSGSTITVNDAVHGFTEKDGNDLFSSVQKKTANEFKEPESEINHDAVDEQDFAKSQTKQESDAKTVLMPPSSSSKEYDRPVNERKVEKIVIFFNDNSFEAYNPHQK